MSVSPPGDPNTGEQGARAVHVDHAQGTQVGDHGTQDNRTTQVAAARDALVAGRDFNVHDLHVHVGGAGGGITGELPPDGAAISVRRAVLRSSYLEQVRRIAPPDPPGLRDRDDELAELARFCLALDGPSYSWWRAEAWAGKSALLSTFVLRPGLHLAGRVRIVSFFITARLAAQDNREAFTQVLLEQLAELTGQVLPAVLPEATREGYLLDLLAQAAAACQQAGGRLVLVVDGLDEDCGVTVGPHAHSIAGLLPADPPAGMRVIVAGRPNPPVPDDVPDWHPLRDPAIIRPLASSPHARDMQRLGRQELHRLLSGSAQGQDLLGLLTAARGGLSGPDLAELSGVPLWEVEEILHTVAGRTFSCRASRWTPGTGAEVYLLGHEELQAAAARYLAGRLPGYQDRLHAWAVAYRDRGWPTGTPEYLLSGYYSLLTLLGDLPRMTACATDAARHDRMLEVTGGDAAALAEARAALDIIAAQEPPHLTRALAVARHRDQLTERNGSIPLGLPAVWAALGQATRAEALAFSLTNPSSQAEALARVTESLVRTGQHQQAVILTAQAELAARAITDPRSQAGALARIAGLLARTGQHQQAVILTAQAESAARTYADSHLQAEALAQVAGALAEAGQHQEAAAIAGQAGTIARAITDPQDQAWALASVAQALAKAGCHTEAATIASQAEAVARTADPQDQALVLTSAVEALAEAGQHQHAEAVALAITDLPLKAWALAELSEVLAGAGEHEHAVRVAVLAETAARAITDLPQRSYRLTKVTGALGKAGQHEHAMHVARVITNPREQAMALAQLAGALAEAGQHQHAESVAHGITEPKWQAEALTSVAEALAKAGEHEHAASIARQAETAARAIPHQLSQAQALTSVAEALSEAGEREQAATIIGQAEVMARAITDPVDQASALTSVAGALAKAGQCQKAVTVAGEAGTAAHAITAPEDQAGALILVAEALLEAGEREQAAAVAEQAEAIARAITDPGECAAALTSAAETLVNVGQHEKAIAVAHSITTAHMQSNALVRVAAALAGAGQRQQAAGIAGQAKAVAQAITRLHWQAMALAQVASALAGYGQYQEAVEIARQAESITDCLTSSSLERAASLTWITIALVEIGQYEQAEATARSIADHPNHRNIALDRLADALTRAGQYQHAEAVARAITYHGSQARSLAGVAEALAKTGETHYASRLVAEACGIGSWVTAVAPILLIEPSASAEVVRITTGG